MRGKLEVQLGWRAASRARKWHRLRNGALQGLSGAEQAPHKAGVSCAEHTGRLRLVFVATCGSLSNGKCGWRSEMHARPLGTH